MKTLIRHLQTASLAVAAALVLSACSSSQTVEEQASSSSSSSSQSSVVSSSSSSKPSVYPIEATVHFAFDSYALNQQAKAKLDDVVQTTQSSDVSRVRIHLDGHTDSIGTEKYNQKLSEQRAQAVADYLRIQGVEAVEWDLQGHSENDPVATNSTDAGRAANRRTHVELTVQ